MATDARSDALHQLSLAERGAYEILRDHYLTAGGLFLSHPGDDPFGDANLAGLYRLCRAFDEYEKHAVAAVARRFFLFSNGSLINAAFEADVIRARDVSAKRRAAVKSRWAQQKKSAAETVTAPLQDVPPTACPPLLSLSGGSARTHAPTPAKKVKGGSPDDLATAEWMFGLIRDVVPGARLPDFDDWANDVRLMRERDERTDKEIRALFAWANRDSFWRTNILSPSKLRDKWLQLAARQRTNSRAAVFGEQDFNDGVSGDGHLL